ncbi:organic radical activating enzyme [Thiovulum sp. ES]|nr:organic radical activating enzyme [Thiovulum sp. ES]
MLNIYNIEKSNFVNGEGDRFVVWVQGCDLGCVGCWNSETWDKNPKNLMSADEVFSQIPQNCDGVTFTGGEPFQQEEALLELAKLVKSRGFHLQVFTGYRLDEIENSPLLKFADVLVSGRYGEEQKIYGDWNFEREIEVDISESGELTITGYPKDKFIKGLK